MQFEDEIGQRGTVVGNPVFASRLGAGATRSKAQQFFDHVVMAAESAHRQGLPIDAPVLTRLNPTLDPEQVSQLLGESKFLRALTDRGIQVTDYDGLTAEQLTFLRIYMDPTLKADGAKRLKIAGVTQAQLEGWLQRDAFRARYTEISEDLLQAAMPVAKQRIAMGIDQGKLDYIKLGMELTGVYNPRGGPSVDVMAFARLVQDVLAQELTKGLPELLATLRPDEIGDEVLRRVGARMTRVMQGQPDEPMELVAVPIDPVEQESA